MDALLRAKYGSVQVRYLSYSIAGGRCQGCCSSQRHDVLPLWGRDGQVEGSRRTVVAGEEDVGRSTLLVASVFGTLGEQEPRSSGWSPPRSAQRHRTSRTAVWHRVRSPPATQVPAWRDRVSRMPLHWGHHLSSLASGRFKRRRSSVMNTALSIRVGPPGPQAPLQSARGLERRIVPSVCARRLRLWHGQGLFGSCSRRPPVPRGW